MAATAGKNASMSFGSTITLRLTAWTVDETIDMMEITDFEDVGIEKMLAGVKRWTATGTGSFDIGNTAVMGSSETLTLTPVSGTTWVGVALLSGRSASTEVSAVNEMTYTFTGNGAIVLS